MKIKYTKFAFVAFLAISMLIPLSMGFGIDGVTFIKEVSPGQELVHNITVSNDVNASTLNMTAEVYGFARNLGGVNIALSPENDTGTYTARPFLSVEPKSFQLGPGERKTLHLTGTVPEDIGPGGKYALVVINTEPKITNGISISTAIQADVMLFVKGTEPIQTGEITDLSASKSDEGVTVNLICKNTGNIYYKPLVGALLKSENGDILANEEPKQIDSSILPTNLRLCKVNLVPKTSLAPGTYTVEAKVTKEDGTLLDSKETTFTV